MFELVGVGIGVFATMVGLWLIFGNRSSSAIKHPDRAWKAQSTVKVIMVEHEYRAVSIPKRLERLTEKILQLDDDGLQAIAEYQMPRIEKRLEQIISLPDIGEMAEELITSTNEELKVIELRYDRNIKRIVEVADMLTSFEEQVAAVEAKQKGLVLAGRTEEGVFISDIPEAIQGIVLTPENIGAYFAGREVLYK